MYHYFCFLHVFNLKGENLFPDLTEHRTCDQKVADVVGEFCSPGSTFCADSYFGVCSTPVLPILFT